MSREYPLPSCSACMGIARRYGVTIGKRLELPGWGLGEVECVSHNESGVVVVVVFKAIGYTQTIDLPYAVERLKAMEG